MRLSIEGSKVIKSGGILKNPYGPRGCNDQVSTVGHVASDLLL